MKRHAFTLIELLIVVAVLGIMGALIVPRIADASPTRLNQAARLLAADLEAAQVQSITQSQEPIAVVFTSTGYHLAPVSDPSTPITNPATRTPYTVTFGQGRASALSQVSFSTITLDDNDELHFGRYGELTNLNADDAPSITLASGGNTLTVSIDPTTGEVSIGAME